MSIDPTTPHRPLLPYGPGGLAGAHAAPPAKPASPPASLARVDEARAARLQRDDPIPPAVRADMARAAELVDELARRGRHVAFGTHQLSGRLVASLTDEQGAVIRRLPLRDVLDGVDPDLVA
jgi:hypothetical protein